MLNIPMEYHLVFIIIAFLIFILVMMLLFNENDVFKTIAALILSLFNMILCIVNAIAFYTIDYPTQDSAGTLFHNVIENIDSLGTIFVAMFYLHLLLIFYCLYIFLKAETNNKQKIDNE